MKGQFNDNAWAKWNGQIRTKPGDQLPIFQRWLSYKQVLFVEINCDQALDPFNMSIEKLCSIYCVGQLVMTIVINTS